MQSSLESSQITLTGRFGGASRCIKKDGVPYNVRGVTIFTVEGGKLKLDAYLWNQWRRLV